MWFLKIANNAYKHKNSLNINEAKLCGVLADVTIPKYVGVFEKSVYSNWELKYHSSVKQLDAKPFPGGEPFVSAFVLFFGLKDKCNDANVTAFWVTFIHSVMLLTSYCDTCEMEQE